MAQRFSTGGLLLAITLSVGLLAERSWACEMAMGYRTNAKPPLITESPVSTGLYVELFEEALARIDCQLQVVREPKARVMHGLQTGRIDFYPGLNFTSERSAYILFMPNGLIDGYIGLTRKGEPQIRSLTEVAERGLVMVTSYGSYDMDAEAFGIDVRRPRDHSLKELVQMVIERRADFHAYNLLAVRYLLTTNPELAGELGVHPHCCQVPEPMYLGFSKQSSQLTVRDNPDYAGDLPLSASNLPVEADPASNAYRLSQVLLEMQRDGSIQALYQKYFSGWDGSVQSALD